MTGCAVLCFSVPSGSESLPGWEKLSVGFDPLDPRGVASSSLQLLMGVLSGADPLLLLLCCSLEEWSIVSSSQVNNVCSLHVEPRNWYLVQTIWV